MMDYNNPELATIATAMLIVAVPIVDNVFERIIEAQWTRKKIAKASDHQTRKANANAKLNRKMKRKIKQAKKKS